MLVIGLQFPKPTRHFLDCLFFVMAKPRLMVTLATMQSETHLKRGSWWSESAVSRLRCLVFLLLLIFSRPVLSQPLRAPATQAETWMKQASEKFISGRYLETIRACEKAVANDEPEEEWRVLLVRALMAIGRYSDASAAMERALAQFPWSIPLRVVAYDVYRSNGATDKAQELLQEVNQLAGRRTWAYRDAGSVIALGRAALLLGADPRRVLENFFDRVKRAYPEIRDVYLASGEVALQKNDFQLAARTFTDGLKKFPDDPDFLFGLAQAYEPSDRKQMLQLLESALVHNTNHVGSLLLLADHLVDAEEYTAARRMLDQALAVNPWHPAAWGYRAVLAHLGNEARQEEEAREKGLRFWRTNPEVDTLIGRKLAQKYRFAEAAEYQRRALRSDEKYLAARMELAQDLLRLGEEDEGWQLAESVHAGDAYDVTAYNLVTLKETLARYRTLTNKDFVVRMTPREADLYGGAVLGLLDRAKSNLCAKYGVTLTRPTTVEIFEKQKDFAVRTFGMPGNPGYLGVCFGPVVTANSPASQAPHPANWQAVLWHEFCHVVTLQLTRNKMPRWVSEGISVYEERRANPAWGQSMTPRFREMMLGPDFTPIRDLSAAFLTPKTGAHLQFAYYESSLVIEFLIEHFGFGALQKILRDLGEGKEINQTIAAHTVSMEKLEKDFAAFASERALQLGPGLDWKKPTSFADMDEDWIAEHPTNFYALQRRALNLIKEKKWEEARQPLRLLMDGYPGQKDENNAYVLMARVHRELQETNAEREVLQKLTSYSADDGESFLRSSELAAADLDWAAVIANSERLLAVNPLIPQPHRQLAAAYEKLSRKPEAIRAYETVLKLDPLDPAEVHFRLGRLLHEEQDNRARRHVLQALEEAPRFRAAHALLLQMGAAASAKTPAPGPVIEDKP